MAGGSVETERLIQGLDRSGLGGTVVARDDPSYERCRRVWNGIVERRPAAIVRARGVADVRRTIEVAAEAGSLIAVRCGGHSFPGFSTCDDGVVLDLSWMNQVVIDPLERRAVVAGGAQLGHLDRAAALHGLVTPAGVVSHTGAAGLTLGGGMGWLSRRMGLTIDSLVGAEVCLADGRVVFASEAEEPELFWGLRGGGGNFGVVTRFVFRLHQLGPILVGSWTYPSTQTGAVLERYSELAADASPQLGTAFTSTATVTRVTAAWTGSGDGAQAAVAPYGRLGSPSSGSVGGVSFLELQSRSDDHFAWGRRYYAKGGFFETIGSEAVDCMTASVASAPTPDSEIYVLQLGGAVTEVADNATAYTGRHAGFYWIVEPVWDDAADDTRCITWGRETAAQLSSLSTSGNYVNEQSDVGGDATLEAYGEQKYTRLATLKARLDPDNLFRLNQNISPAQPPREAKQ
jgi:FAD/FMN-containing dehydrogenase